MSAPQKFRSAFNGFNREDVAGYLQYLTSKHTAQVNQLTSEADFLRRQLAQTQPAGSEAVLALQQERDDLRAQLDDLQAQFEMLQARCTELEQQTAAAPICPPDEELEIYRRAERTERMARERADMVYRQTNIALNEASVRVNDMANQVVPIADQILSQISQLQQTVVTSKQSLQDAMVILGTIRPDNQ